MERKSHTFYYWFNVKMCGAQISHMVFYLILVSKEWRKYSIPIYRWEKRDYRKSLNKLPTYLQLENGRAGIFTLSFVSIQSQSSLYYSTFSIWIIVLCKIMCQLSIDFNGTKHLWIMFKFKKIIEIKTGKNTRWCSSDKKYDHRGYTSAVTSYHIWKVIH